VHVLIRTIGAPRRTRAASTGRYDGRRETESLIGAAAYFSQTLDLFAVISVPVVDYLAKDREQFVQLEGLGHRRQLLALDELREPRLLLIPGADDDSAVGFKVLDRVEDLAAVHLRHYRVEHCGGDRVGICFEQPDCLFTVRCAERAVACTGENAIGYLLDCRLVFGDQDYLAAVQRR